jgi:hypothetical protein
MKKIYCFDLDGVICKTPKTNNYKRSKPIIPAIKKINEIFKQGNIIIIFTARYMGRSNQSKILAKKKGYEVTKKQLKKWGLNYNKLIFGKPSYDIIIDDKSYNYNNKWIKKIK